MTQDRESDIRKASWPDQLDEWRKPLDVVPDRKP